VTTYHRARIARHEAGHVAGMVLGGRLPCRVTADWPATGTLGEMEMDWGDGVDPAGARILAVAILLGPLAEHDLPTVWPPDWPPDRDAAGDEGQLAACCRYLKLDEDDYYELVRQAHHTAQSREWNRLCDLIAQALELKDELTADDLRHLLGSELLHKYGIPTPREEHAHAP
jgi:hypothetical protein